MNKFSPIILAILFAIVSCVPVVRTSGVSSTPFLRIRWEFFAEDSERILVLPVWGRCPSFAVTEFNVKNTIFYFDKYIFLTAKELPYLHKMIPSKTSSVLVSPVAAFGRPIFLNSIIVISETGRVFITYCPQFEFGVVKCLGYNADISYSEWKNYLILALNSSGNVSCPPYSVNSTESLLGTCRISFNKKEKQSILDFLHRIKIKTEKNEFKDASIEIKKILLDDPNYRSRKLNESCKFHSDCVGDLMCINNVCTNR